MRRVRRWRAARQRPPGRHRRTRWRRRRPRTGNVLIPTSIISGYLMIMGGLWLKV